MLKLIDLLKVTDLDEMVHVEFNNNEHYVVAQVSDFLVGDSDGNSALDYLDAQVLGISKSNHENALFKVSVRV